MTIEELAKKHYNKLIKTKLLVLDIDGTLTDGKLFYMGKELGWSSSFDIKDGYGIKLLMQNQIGVALISGAPRREAVLERCKMLGIKHVYFECHDKVAVFGALRECYQGIPDDNCVFMGDDLNDLALLKKVGFSACPNDAVDAVKESVHYVSTRKGGDGAVREVIDLILAAKKLG